ncbi:MAG: ribonuclease G [Legionellales bacterium]|nr:ribonuclease G [Legionellales bacterium]
MAEELLISVLARQIQISLVENGVLQETLIERTDRSGLVGNIYLGKVLRVLPGMQSAFVDVGLSRAAFLHVADMSYATPETADEVLEPPNITSLLSEGQQIPVQIVKDPIGNKGARLTTRLSLAARYLVWMPGLDRIGVSQRIADEAERERLKAAVESLTQDHNYIIRTAAEGCTVGDIRSDIEFLNRMSLKVKDRLKTAKPGVMVYEELPVTMRTLRDLVWEKTDRVRIDNRELFQRAVLFAENFVPVIKDKIHFYEGARPLFDLYNIEEEMRRSLSRQVSLKSGGYLVIDQREAMTTIDVNTGGFVGHRNLEETIFKTNLEATHTIARQMRLRNLGGMIIIDFIDMIKDEHKKQVLRALEKALMSDHVKTTISGVSELGLVEVTRKRTRQSIEQQLCETCPTCSGRGTIRSVETVSNDIIKEILRSQAAYDAEGYLVLASQSVVDYMIETSLLADLEDRLSRPVKLQVEVLYNQENYDVVLT